MSHNDTQVHQIVKYGHLDKCTNNSLSAYMQCPTKSILISKRTKLIPNGGLSQCNKAFSGTNLSNSKRGEKLYKTSLFIFELLFIWKCFNLQNPFRSSMTSDYDSLRPKI